jgi:hypothetical protein
MEILRKRRASSSVSWAQSDADESAPSPIPELYHDRVVDEDAEEILVERTNFFIRLATTDQHQRQGSVLVRRMYSWRGYSWQAADEAPHSANQVTLQACGPDGVFGTLTLRVDSPNGLMADELYRDEIDAYRRRGAMVCEMTSFAVDPDYGGRHVLACLFQLIYVYARRMYQRTDLFIEVNPRHVGFYGLRLGFAVAGQERTCERVGAPAVLMHLDLDRVAARRHGGDDNVTATEPSLYPYFLSPHEEEGLCRRIGVTAVEEPRMRRSSGTS